jgi:hypothetical protein
MVGPYLRLDVCYTFFKTFFGDALKEQKNKDLLILFLPSTDHLQQAEDYVRGCILQFQNS